MDKSTILHKNQEKEWFNEHLNDYINKYCRGRWLAYKSHAYMLHKRLLTKQNSRILDIGCGPIPTFIKFFESLNNYYCLDISEANLLYIKNNFNQCINILADAESIPFKEGRFDLIILFGVLHHIPNPNMCIKEIKRLLRKGGMVICHEPTNYWDGKMESPNEKGFSKEEIAKLFGIFNKYKITTYNHLWFEQSILKIHWKIEPLFKKYRHLWSAIFSIERLFDTIGIEGTDFLITAYN